MLLTVHNYREALAENRRIVGFWGVPPRDILMKTAAEHGALLLDLDVDLGAPPSKQLPDAFCHIIRNCVDNALALRSQLVKVVAATGKEKCDAGRYAGWLVHELTGIPVDMTVNEEAGDPVAAELCQSFGPLKDRVIRIMHAVVNPLDDAEKTAANGAVSIPTHGFWGTPPHPIGLLDLFPPTTHIFGWTRCVAIGRPADLDAEMEVMTGLPTVFFSQGFCAKSQLARHLAEVHRGMHVDVHDGLGAATRAKIEAFVRLATRQGGHLDIR